MNLIADAPPITWIGLAVVFTALFFVDLAKRLIAKFRKQGSTTER